LAERAGPRNHQEFGTIDSFDPKNDLELPAHEKMKCPKHSQFLTVKWHRAIGFCFVPRGGDLYWF
jgi:hypothetical protein